MPYKVVLTPDVTGGYVATVPALPGCVTQGDTLEEAVANLQEAMDVYIATCVDLGDILPPPEFC